MHNSRAIEATSDSEEGIPSLRGHSLHGWRPWHQAVQLHAPRSTGPTQSGVIPSALSFHYTHVILGPHYQDAPRVYNVSASIGGGGIGHVVRTTPVVARFHMRRQRAFVFGLPYLREDRIASEAIRFDSGRAGAYNSRGVAYGNLGQHQRAIQDYDEAIRLNPRLAEARSNRAVAYDSLAQYARAIQDFDEAIAIDPRFAPAYAGRGIARLRLYQDAAADGDFRRALELEPSLRTTLEPLITRARTERKDPTANRPDETATNAFDDALRLQKAGRAVHQRSKNQP